jgi:hypothetical protein
MNPLDVECPACGSEPGRRCRTLRTNRSTDTHLARWDLCSRNPRSDTPEG